MELHQRAAEQSPGSAACPVTAARAVRSWRTARSYFCCISSQEGIFLTAFQQPELTSGAVKGVLDGQQPSRYCGLVSVPGEACLPSLHSTCLCLLAIPAMAGPGRQIAWANAGCVLPTEQASKAEYLHSLTALGYEHVKGTHVAYPVNLWLLLSPGRTAIFPPCFGQATV